MSGKTWTDAEVCRLLEARIVLEWHDRGDAYLAPLRPLAQAWPKAALDIFLHRHGRPRARRRLKDLARDILTAQEILAKAWTIAAAFGARKTPDDEKGDA